MPASFYPTAHLIASAVRVLAHQKKSPPGIEDVCEMLSYSVEQGTLFIRKLEKAGVLRLADGPFGARIFIEDHLKIEAMKDSEEPDRLKEEVVKFKSSKKDFDAKIAALKKEQADRKKELHEKLQKAFGKEIEDKDA